jgi:hypothetical protein
MGGKAILMAIAYKFGSKNDDDDYNLMNKSGKYWHLNYEQCIKLNKNVL